MEFAVFSRRRFEGSLSTLPYASRLAWDIVLYEAEKLRGRVFLPPFDLAKAAVITIEQAREALAEFQAPDPNSATEAEEGRRLIAIDGMPHWYKVVTWEDHEKERKAYFNRLRQQRWYAKNAAQQDDADLTQPNAPKRDLTKEPEPELKEPVVTGSLVVDSPENKHEKSKALFTPPAFATVWKDEILAVKIPKPAGKKRAEAAYRQKVRTAEAYERFQRGLANYRASKRVKEGFVQDAGRWFQNFDEWADYSDQKAEKGAAATAEEPAKTLRERIEFYAPNVYEFIRTRGDPDSSEAALKAFEEVFQRDISAPNGDGTRWAKWKRVCGEVSIDPKTNSEATK